MSNTINTYPSDLSQVGGPVADSTYDRAIGGYPDKRGFGDINPREPLPIAGDINPRGGPGRVLDVARDQIQKSLKDYAEGQKQAQQAEGQKQAVKPDHGLKDSGERREFSTGAVRDRGALKGAPVLRPIHALNRYDIHCEKGARKYAARNWEKGIPLSEFYNSAQRHADKLLAGYVDEDHADGWLWNVMGFIETRHRIKVGLLPKELDDMPTTFAGLEPNF